MNSLISSRRMYINEAIVIKYNVDINSKYLINFKSL